jgi:two-component system sensor histidine kinase MtrB
VGVPLGGLDASYVEFVPLTEVDRTLQRVARGLLLAVAGATALGALVGRWLTGRVLRPVRRTAEAADGIREGALDRRLEAEHDADLEPLTRSFNAMVDSLQARIEREQRFASDVSHELRSPLATMDAALSVARRRVSEPAANAALDALEGEVARFRELIVDLLEIARSEAGVAELRLEEIDPTTLAESVLASTHRQSVQLIVEPTAPHRAQLDKRRLGQALVNLLDNADNYAGGAVRLVVAGDDDHVRFVVDDDGPGIPEHEREHVFGRFSRGANAEVAGTGLGLALVAEHVRRHGGTVSISDADHGGARFTIEIPRHQP